MPAEENKALVRRYFETIDRGDYDALDQFVVAEYVDHNPPPIPGLAPGLAGVKQACRYFQQAHPDGRHLIEDQVAEGDKVVTRLTARGTHTGDLLGIAATGRELVTTGIAIHRVTGGKLVEHWAESNLLGLLQQLGVVPPMGPPS
jgi:predicted ester cyclase